MNTIQTTVNRRLLTKASRLFTGTLQGNHHGAPAYGRGLGEFVMSMPP